jgi:predicted amidohydrolase
MTNNREADFETLRAVYRTIDMHARHLEKFQLYFVMPQDLTVIALQTDIVWENPKGNREKIEKMVSTVAVCDIVVLPEMFTTGFQPKGMNLAETMNGETVQWMKNLAQQRNFVVAGSIIVHENEKLYNRFIWAFPDGKTEFYDKRHLFSYGKEHLHYAAGQKRVVLDCTTMENRK